MSNTKSRFKLLGLLGLFCLLAINAMADTSYTVNMAATGTINFTDPPTGNNDWPNAGYCYSLIPGQSNASTTGTLTLLSAGGLTLSFGTGLGSVGGCGASFTGAVISTTPGVYTGLLSGTTCNDDNCNGPNPADPGIAGFVPSTTGQYFLVSDQFPQPNADNCEACTGGGSLIFLLKVAGDTTTVVPEPSSVVLLSTILLGVAMLVRRRLAHS